MATVKVTFYKCGDYITKDEKFPLILRLGHARNSRDIPFKIHIKEDQYDFSTGKITGIVNAARHTKRVRKIYSEVDLWMDELIGEIRYWEINKLKREVERIFFKKSPPRSILVHGAIYLNRLRLEERFSTASSYEDPLKAMVKFRRIMRGENDMAPIKTLFKIDNGRLTVLDAVPSNFFVFQA